MRTRVGYAGGTLPSPTYYNLGDHSETIQIDYDPTLITYEELLDLFWQSHDATARSFSRQYMSIIITHDEEQQRLATASKAREEARIGETIHTEIIPLTTFTLAETYHQKYRLQNQPDLMDEYRAMYPNDGWIDSTAAARVNGFLGGYGSAASLEALLGDLGLSGQAEQRLQSLVKRSGGSRWPDLASLLGRDEPGL